MFENPVTHIPVKSAFTVEGRFIDIAHYIDGRSEIIRDGHNIVTDCGLALIVGALGNLANGVTRWQVGSGDPAWDTAPVEASAETTALVAPVFMKPVTVSYWDIENNRFSPTPTNTIDVRVVFMAEEANAPLREFGLVGPDPTCVLFNYVVHERISKSENFNLERIMRITARRA
ncbi:MAG: hypothetical protein BWY28_02227 [bacterium ADurb.Bin236]|nr:MAG: hypothetical protein BWY28_02227 [bacterium ADurb.Bin236]HOY63927.1 hypothetical protein [bacterium]HPN94749.1 hypothetical protein [bacterium]